MTPDQLNQLAQETAEKCNLFSQQHPEFVNNCRSAVLRALETVEGKQKLADVMMNLGLATGHGESLEDLLKELELQFKELRTELTALRATIDRIWTALGISTYEQAKPSSIDEHVTTLRAREERLREALDGLLQQIDAGHLVRDTSNDNHSDWAIRQLPLVASLSNARQALAGSQGQSNADHLS